MKEQLQQLKKVREMSMSHIEEAHNGAISHDVLNAMARATGNVIRACALELQYRDNSD